MIVDGVKYQGSLGKESLEVGKLDGLGWRASDLNFAAKTIFWARRRRAASRAWARRTASKAPKLSYDVTSLKNPNLKAGFDKLSGADYRAKACMPASKDPETARSTPSWAASMKGSPAKAAPSSCRAKRDLDIGLKKAASIPSR